MTDDSIKIQVLVSTMDQKDYSLIEKMNINTDAVVINQCDEVSQHCFEFNGSNILWVNSKERGLSKSRNLAIKNATADICLLADDDLIYRDDCKKTVMEAFEANSESDLIAFTVRGIEKTFKKYADTPHKVGYLSSMKISSVEIAFRRKSFVDNGIAFDELIGAGTEFKMGEENSLLFSCLRKGLKSRFEPKEIADLHIGKSTWFNGYNKEHFHGRGAAFTSMSRLASSMLIFQFAIRKLSIYKSEIGFWKATGYMFEGKRMYLSKRRKQRRGLRNG